MSISDVLMEYERIREKNSIEEQRRLEEVLKKVPEFRKIHANIKQLQQKRIFNAFTDNENLTAQIRNLLKESEDLLVNFGFDRHYLEPIFSCKICRDTGLTENGIRCNCFTKRILEDKLKEARLADNQISFEKFDLTVFDDTADIENGKTQRDFMKKIKKLAEEYANGFPDCPLLLVLAGSAGLGKTYISKCIMRRIIERGYTAAYYTAYAIFSLFHKDRIGENVDLDPVFQVPLLILDDFGSEPMTRNVTKEYFFDLINERQRAELHTIILTNLGFHEIKEWYGESISSRLLDAKNSQKIIFKGNDIRISNKS